MKWYKTTIKIEVLSQDEDVAYADLDQLRYLIDYGECVGTKEILEVKELSEQELKSELDRMGSDYAQAFFAAKP